MRSYFGDVTGIYGNAIAVVAGGESALLDALFAHTLVAPVRYFGVYHITRLLRGKLTWRCCGVGDECKDALLTSGLLVCAASVELDDALVLPLYQRFLAQIPAGGARGGSPGGSPDAKHEAVESEDMFELKMLMLRGMRVLLKHDPKVGGSGCSALGGL